MSKKFSNDADLEEKSPLGSARPAIGTHENSFRTNNNHKSYGNRSTDVAQSRHSFQSNRKGARQKENNDGSTITGGGFWSRRAQQTPGRIRAVKSSIQGTYHDVDEDDIWSAGEDDLILAHTPAKIRLATKAMQHTSRMETGTVSSSSPVGYSSSSDPHSQNQEQNKPASQIRESGLSSIDPGSVIQVDTLSKQNENMLSVPINTLNNQSLNNTPEHQDGETTSLAMPKPPISLENNLSKANPHVSHRNQSDCNIERKPLYASVHPTVTIMDESSRGFETINNPTTFSSNARKGIIPGSIAPVSRFSGVGCMTSRGEMRIGRFEKALNNGNIDLDGLRKLSWAGVPRQLRPTVWRLLCGYVPANLDRRQATLERKRAEYKSLLSKYFHTRADTENRKTFHQIQIDVPRTCPSIEAFRHPIIKEMLERVLYIWAIRHPGSGYVQGMNGLITPFIVVFLDEFLDCDFAECDASTVPQPLLDDVEADCFWCLSKLLDGIQDNYTSMQPGITQKLQVLDKIIERIENKLYRHLQEMSAPITQFAFRWINCLLMRELPMHCTIRLWDTCLAEKDGFSSLFIYVCASFLKVFSSQLQSEHDFPTLMHKLLHLPTSTWSFDDIEMVLADAFTLQTSFEEHFARNKSN